MRRKGAHNVGCFDGKLRPACSREHAACNRHAEVVLRLHDGLNFQNFFDRDAGTMRNVKDNLAESFDKAHRYLMQYLFKNVVVGFARRPTTAVRACIAYFFITTQRHICCVVF